MRVVSPYRPFEPESIEHRRLGPFDWHAALRMAWASVTDVYKDSSRWTAITDVDTSLPVPALKYQTTHRRLMLWILEVCLRYLESKDFDQDTMMMSPDVLLYQDVTRFITADLGVIVRLRPKYLEKRTLHNPAQFWRVAAKDRLVAFYRRALTIAEGLSEDQIRWGADTIPLAQLVAPILGAGVVLRAGLLVRCIDERSIMMSPTKSDVARLKAGGRVSRPDVALADFKYLSKKIMPQFFASTIGRQAVSA